MPGVSAFCLRKLSLLILILVDIFSVNSTEELGGNPPKVRTKQGVVQGFTEYFNNEAVDIFMGIPYAAPPIGHLRFRKPRPPSRRDYILVATEQPPPCYQYHTGPFLSYDDKPGHSEDCLYLNIWTPSRRAFDAKKSVMFWIHGGGFHVGSTRQEEYDGKALSVTGDVVIVTFNYRLGTLGFYYSGTDDAPGNAGLYDILRALRWVRENIEAFGGDKDSITLFGQSAGAKATGFLGVSPLTRGLFKRAILESDSAASTEFDDNEEVTDASERLAKEFHCLDDSTAFIRRPSKVVQCLRGIEAMKLLNNSVTPRTLFKPRFGDEFLPENPRENIILGSFYHTDIMIGVTKNEGSHQLSTSMPTVFGFFGDKDVLFNKTFARDILNSHFSKVENAEAIADFYLDPVPDDDLETIRRKTCEAMGDYSNVCPCVYHAEAFAKRRNNVYFYVFDQMPSISPWGRWEGAGHFDEVEFVFGRSLLYPYNYTRNEKILSTYMMKKWSNFAKTGTPGPDWPSYSEAARDLKILKSPLRMGKGPHTRNCDFFRPYFGL